MCSVIILQILGVEIDNKQFCIWKKNNNLNLKFDFSIHLYVGGDGFHIAVAVVPFLAAISMNKLKDSIQRNH